MSAAHPELGSCNSHKASRGKAKMTKLRSRCLLAGVILGTTALTAPAHAQQYGYSYVPPVDVPPVQSRVDEFNVDLITHGIAAKVYASISIGPKGPGGLKYVWSDSNRAGTDVNVGLSVSGATYSVYIGSSTSSFTLNGALGTGTFTNDQGGGETLVYNSSTGQFTFTTSNGTVLLFSSASGAGPYTPQTLTYPAGETLTYYPHGVVTSNLGYQLRPTLNADGSWNKIVLFNMNNETCDPTAASCTLTGSWPTIDFAAQTVNGNPTVTWGWQYNASTGVTTYTETVPITSTQNEVRTYQVGADGRVTSVTDGNGVWGYTYQAGAPVAYKYAGNGSAADPSRQIRVNEWDQASGLMTLDLHIPGNGATGDAYNYTYDSFHRIASIKHNGVLTTYTYDPRGNVTEADVTPTTGDTTKNIVTKAVYPASCTSAKTCNQPTSVTDGDGNTTTFAYSTVHGGVTTATYPAVNVAGVGSVHPVLTYGYASKSETWKSGTGATVTGSGVYKLASIARCMTTSTCTTTTNPGDEVLTSIVYSTTAGLQPSSVTSGSNASATPVLQAKSSYTYNPNGDIQTVDGPLSGTADTSWFAYDNDRRLTGVIGPSPGNGQGMRAIAVKYTAGGEADTTTAGTATAQSSAALGSMAVKQKVQASYNLQSLKTTDTIYDKNGAVAGITNYNYSPERQLECVAMRNTLTSADACTQTSGGSDLITKYTYDDAGDLLTTRNGYTSDAQTPDLTSTWTDATMLATQQDGKGNTTTYSYDGFNRRGSTCYADSSTDCELLTYDSNNNILSRRLRDGTTSIGYTYDALNRLVTKVLPEGTVTYNYDLLGDATSVAQGSSTLALTYDQLRRNLTQTSPLGTVASTWDLGGRRTKLTYPDNSYVTYGYLTTNELQTITDSSGVVLATYGYGELGNRSAVTYGNGATQNYSYDALYRLSQLNTDLEGAATANDVVNTLAHNPVSEITSLGRSNDKYSWVSVSRNYSYSANVLNQYASNGATSFGYDANGNLHTSGSTDYCYDSENRLVGVGTAANCTATASLSYDPVGRLSNVVGTATSRFAYDGPEMVAEYDGSATPALRAKYVFGPAMDEPIVQYDGAGNRTYLSGDERGSVIALTNNAGSVTATDTYDEYGMRGSANSNAERFEYTGQMYLSDLGLDYYKSRFYSPTLGRFLQTDPIGYADGPNWYAYVHNDPVDGSDALGLDCTITYTVTVSNGVATATPGPMVCPPPTTTTANGPSDDGGTHIDCTQGFGCDMGGLDDPGLIISETPSGPGGNWVPPVKMPNTPFVWNGSRWAPNPNYSDKCATDVLKKSALPVLADAAGLIPGETAAVTATRFGAAVFSGVLNAWHGDGPGVALAYGAANTELFGPSGAAIQGAKLLPGIGQAISLVSLGRDLYHGITDLAACGQ